MVLVWCLVTCNHLYLAAVVVLVASKSSLAINDLQMNDMVMVHGDASLDLGCAFSVKVC